jgi:hypothetical protein
MALLRAADEGAGERRDLESTQTFERSQRRRQAIPVAMQPTGDDVDFPCDSFRTQAGSRTHQPSRFRVEQRACQRGRRRAVADAHFATDEQLGTFRAHSAGRIQAGVEGQRELARQHRGIPKEVGGSAFRHERLLRVPNPTGLRIPRQRLRAPRRARVSGR